MIKKLSAFRIRFSGKIRGVSYVLTGSPCPLTPGFTMIETLVAISLLTIAIVAPMSLTEQSLSSAYYARDQVTASYLAQEAIEAVRQVRDDNVLLTALGTPTNLLTGLPSTTGQPFIIDTRNDWMQLCSGACPNVQTDGTFYGYGQGMSGWTSTYFNRTVTAAFANKPDGTQDTDEITITVTVSWQSGGFQARSITMRENLYRWINDGSAAG